MEPALSGGVGSDYLRQSLFGVTKNGEHLATTLKRNFGKDRGGRAIRGGCGWEIRPYLQRYRLASGLCVDRIARDSLGGARRRHYRPGKISDGEARGTRACFRSRPAEARGKAREQAR